MKFFNCINPGKTYRQRIVVFISMLLCAVSSYGQDFEINGEKEVIAGQSYVYYPTTYNPWAYAYNYYSWTIVGGYVKGSPGTTFKEGFSNDPYATFIEVIWTGSYGSITMVYGDMGEVTKDIQVIQPLDPGTLSPAKQSINKGMTAATIAGTASSGGSDWRRYEWYKSNNGGDWTIIDGAIYWDYSPGALTEFTFFKRKVISGSNEAYTNQVSIDVLPTLTASISSSQTINFNTAPATLTSAAAGGNYNFSYQWESSTNNSTWSNVGTASTYAPGALTTTTYYRLKVTSNGQTITSNTVTITVYPQLTASIASSQTINYSTAPGTLTAAVSGGNGSYSYQWQSSPDNSTWTNKVTSSTYNTGNLTTTTYYRCIVTSNGVSVTSNTITITVYPQVTASIASSQTINYNTAPATLTCTAGGGNGSYSYQWRKFANNSLWTTVGYSSTYAPGALTTTTYYQCIVTSNGANIASNTITITVYPQLTASIASSQTINYNTAPATLTSAVGGGNGSYSYQWESSTNNSTWGNAGTAATLSPGALTQTTYYRLKVTSNGQTITANTVTITVNPLSATLAITSTTPSGNGSVNTLSCTASGGGVTYAWYYAANGGSSYQLIPGATGSSYTTGVVTSNTNYYVVVTSGSSTVNTNRVSISMPNAPTITSTTTSPCNGASATLTASGGSGSYKWYNSAGTQLGTGTTYSTAASGTYYAVSYSNFGVSAQSNTITVSALTSPGASSITGSSVCVLGSSAQLAHTVSGGTWSSSNTSVAPVASNGVVTGKAAGTATITYTATNTCGTSSVQLGITVVPFADLALTLGNGIADPLRIDTISLSPNTVKTIQFRQDTAHSLAHTIKNVLALRVVEESNQYVPGDFSAAVDIKIEYGHSDADIYKVESARLQVNYTKDEPNKYNNLHYFAIDNAEFMRVTVLQVEAPTTVNSKSFDTKQVLLLTHTMGGKRYYQLADNKQPVLTYTAPAASPTPDQLPVSWTVPDHTHHNGVQLEWTWLENEMKNSYVVNNTFDTELLFNTTATRIDLPGGASAGSYTIPLLYDGTGTLYMRVRAINTMPTGSRSHGPWSAVSTYGFGGHNNNLNWQTTTTFAEDGKRKTVIQYYDGSLRPRQTVTKDNTTNQTVVAETLYDMQGRPAVQLLPAPGINNIIAYTKNLNKFNTQADNTNPADYFDFTTAALGNYGTTALNQSSGTAQYYSTQNPDAATGYHKNIAAANGYPYTVTRYTPDATGRILRQSGAGDSLRMGSGHETKYYYGTPAQEELDALFGTEAGNYTHYFKNMVQDANGQMSISYADMRGRTVATALAGEAPAGMQALNISDTSQYKNQAGKLLTRNLLSKNSNTLKGSSIESINSILVPFKTNHQFSYQLTKKTLTLPTCNGGTVSYDCRFDLQIAVTDESGDQPPVVYNYTNIDAISFNQTLLLEAGSYSVRKTLTINAASLAAVIAQYNTPGVGICKTQQQLADSVYAADSTGCGAPVAPLTSTACATALGSYSSYLSNYAASIGKTAAQLPAATVNDVRSQYLSDSAFCAGLNLNASNTLAAIRRQMLADMVPYSGQYAASTGNGTMHSRYNIFAASAPFYKYPKTPAGTAGSYYDAYGNTDASVPASRLATLSQADFETEFQESWSGALLPYHPEYKKLRFAEDSLGSSFNFTDSLVLVPAPFNAIAADPYFAIASRQADKDSMTRYSNTAWKDMNNYSLWQTAYGDALGCKVMADPTARTTCYNSMPKTQTATGASINTGSGTVTLTTAQQSQAWKLYKGLYLQVRNQLLYRYINVRPGTTDTADNSTLVAQGYRLHFPYRYEQASGGGSLASGSLTSGSLTSFGMTTNTTSASSCEGYIIAWKNALLTCPQLAAKDEATRDKILNSITGKLLQVCQSGTDAANPGGASTPRPTGGGAGGWGDFEQAINYVLDSAGIARSEVCNPYAIQYPKPWGKNQPLVAQQQIAVIDTCHCSQWSQLKTEMNNAGTNTSSLTSANQYLKNKYKDTLTQPLFDGLQQCNGDVYRYNCKDSTVSSPKGSYTVRNCDTLWARPLPAPQPLPAFLTCGFDSSSTQCYTCNDFVNLESSFYSLYGKRPVFTADSTGLSDSTIALNNLFARYVNFKTGLGYNWLYYAGRLSAGGCSVESTALDLELNTSLTGTTQAVKARRSITLNPGFEYESVDNKTFTAEITGDAGAGEETVLICPAPSTEGGGGSLTSGSLTSFGMTACELTRNRATDKAGVLYEYRQQQLVAGFAAAYLKACLGVTETFTVKDTIKEYHYTLYYYDQAGNLVKTVPPKGVRPDYSSAFLSSVQTQRANMLAGNSYTVTVPQHSLVTRYCYNSVNQVVIQKSPDGGSSRFWYDRLARLAASQHNQQKSASQYSYTLYDALGRITEVGQLTSTTAITNSIAKSESSLQSWLSTAGSSRTQITQTVYDIAYTPIDGVMLSQKHLRNRVSYTQVINAASDPYPASATYYTYDVHGNVDTLLQDFGNSKGIANAMNQNDNRFKKIVYAYDLVSGKVNQVSYQPGQADAYYHRYAYDAENRLTDVYTARDSVLLEFFPEREAHYNYYKHGPLAQTILGQLQVQKQDYAYTLQGWLKAVNPTMGGTLTNGTDTTEAFPIAQDVYGFSLHYYKNDYKAIGHTPQATSVLGALAASAAPLYNGNIAAMAVNIPKLGAGKVYNYHYDQLNRIVAMDAFNGLNVNSGTFTPIQINDYKERVSYDPNGNILTYKRNGDAARQAMDDLSYYYKANTNQLHKVTDAAANASAASYSQYNDLKTGQADNNYQYDEIGNLVKDNAEGITNISWTVYGKIASITKSGSVIKYVYDAAGNRIIKQTATDTTIYVRDASGNVMSVYSKPASGTLIQSEVHLYGSSRIGMATTPHPIPETITLSGGFAPAIKCIFTRGKKIFELGNHLQNVLATVSDRRVAVSAGGTTIDYYTASVLSATDYFPGGMDMPGRSYGTQGRHGFNGKERDKEVVQYDYGFRIYDARLVRFKSIDPLFKSYPFYTPYQFAGNMPIAAIDLDGAEAKVSINFGTVTKDRTAIQISANVDIKVQIINLSAAANKDMYHLYDVASNLKADLENKLSGSSTQIMNLPWTFKSKGNTVTDVETAKSAKDFKDYSVTYSTTTRATVEVVDDISKIDNNAWVFAVIDEVRDDPDREVRGKAYGAGYGKVTIGESKDFAKNTYAKQGRNTIFHEVLHLLGATDTYPPNSGLPGTQNKDNAMYSTNGKMKLTAGQLIKEIWRATIGNVDGPFRTGASRYKQPSNDKDKQPTQQQLKEFIKENGTASKLKED